MMEKLFIHGRGYKTMPEGRASGNRTKLVIAALAVAVIVLSAALATLWLSGWMAGQQQNAYTVGYQDGAAAAIVAIMQRSNNCQVVPVYAGNATISLVDASCLIK